MRHLEPVSKNFGEKIREDGIRDSDAGAIVFEGVGPGSDPARGTGPSPMGPVPPGVGRRPVARRRLDTAASLLAER